MRLAGQNSAKYSYAFHIVGPSCKLLQCAPIQHDSWMSTVQEQPADNLCTIGTLVVHYSKLKRRQFLKRWSISSIQLFCELLVTSMNGMHVPMKHHKNSLR